MLRNQSLSSLIVSFKNFKSNVNYDSSNKRPTDTDNKNAGSSSSSTDTEDDQTTDSSSSSPDKNNNLKNAEVAYNPVRKRYEYVKAPPQKPAAAAARSFGSLFDQLRMLPSMASTRFQQKSESETSLNDDDYDDDDYGSINGSGSADSSSWSDPDEKMQHSKNFKLLKSWTDDGGRSSRFQAMTIAASLYNTKVSEEHIQAEMSPKEKFAYKKFCLEIDDKLQMISKFSLRGREPFSERTFRKIWYLYALYTKALSSEEIRDERNTNLDITRRAITHLVKRTIVGPELDSSHNNLKEYSKSKPTNLIAESVNPVLSKCLQDPTHAFLIVYGKFVSFGKVKKFERLNKLLHFNKITKHFYEKLLEPPAEDVDVDTYLLRLKQEQQQRQRFQQSKHDLFPNFSNSSHHSLQHQRSMSLPLPYSTILNRHSRHKPSATRERYSSILTMRSEHSLMNLDNLDDLIFLKECRFQGDDPNDVSLADIKTLKRKVQLLVGKKRICLLGSRYEVLHKVAIQSGFEIVNENDVWNINWSDCPMPQEKICEVRRLQDMYSVFWGLSAPLQKMNHFPGMYEICRKDRLGRNLNRLRRIFPNEFNFFPETWDLPTEQGDLITYARRRKNVTFIVKPESGCQGKGIFLLRNLKKLSPFTKCVCQVYVPRPFLIDGYKFDQRIYVLITCVDPLRVYIYEEGIARFATVKYEPPTDVNLEVVFMHLTNYSLNKFSESYVREGDGSKRKVSAIYKWMSEKGCDVAKLTRAIDEIVIKTLLCAAPTLKHNYKTCFPKRDRGCSCFELLGFDILIDRNLNPILLEVNHSPSFNVDLPVDSEVKTAMLKDMFNMIYLGDELSGSGAARKQKKKKRLLLRRRKNSAVATAAAADDSSGSVPPGIKRRRAGAAAHSPSSPLGTAIDESNDAAAAADAATTAATVPIPLRKQFQHELKHKGKFRLIYSSEKPGKFMNLMDVNYCGYPTLSGVIGPCDSSLVQQQQQLPQPLFESKLGGAEKKKKKYPFPFESDNEVIMKKKGQGQPYLEPAVAPAFFTMNPQLSKTIRKLRPPTSKSLSLITKGSTSTIQQKLKKKKVKDTSLDKKTLKIDSKQSASFLNNISNDNKSKPAKFVFRKNNDNNEIEGAEAKFQSLLKNNNNKSSNKRYKYPYP